MDSDSDGNEVLLDATPGYLKNPASPCRIARMWPGTKIVMVLR